MRLSEDDARLGRPTFKWGDLREGRTIDFVCGYCGKNVATKDGWYGEDTSVSIEAYIRICPKCHCPTFIIPPKRQFPSPAPGTEVENVPEPLARLYDEARLSAGAGAHTASVMACRKMLMNIAVDKGAAEGLNFFQYVQYLADNNYVPPDGRGWVDYIRRRGNEANHEIQLMELEDAEALIRFVEMLLRFIYEFPELVPSVEAGG